jgi:protein-S-isoprenylcysteine O-methyltransferase Ste14
MKPNSVEILPALFGNLLFLIFILPFFMIWIPKQIISSPTQFFHINLGPVRYVGMVPILLGAVVYLSCLISFVFSGKGTPILFTTTQKLIVTGPYRFVRNPMYIAGVSVLAGEAILFQSPGILLYCLAMSGIFHVHVLMEETFLKDTFGETYEAYRKAVPRWIPRLIVNRKTGAAK